MTCSLLLPLHSIQNQIYTIRGYQVMLDKDLAPLYATETRTLKQAVRRNWDRFPDDFMFELSDEDIKTMVSQSVIPRIWGKNGLPFRRWAKRG